MSYNITYLGDVKVLAKWQIVIPSEIRKTLDIHSGDLLKVTLWSDGAIGIMKEKDLEEALRKFQQMDFNEKESIDEIKDMQESINQIMKHLNIWK